MQWDRDVEVLRRTRKRGVSPGWPYCSFLSDGNSPVAPSPLCWQMSSVPKEGVLLPHASCDKSGNRHQRLRVTWEGATGAGHGNLQCSTPEKGRERGEEGAGERANEQRVEGVWAWRKKDPHAAASDFCLPSFFPPPSFFSPAVFLLRVGAPRLCAPPFSGPWRAYGVACLFVPFGFWFFDPLCLSSRLFLIFASEGFFFLFLRSRLLRQFSFICHFIDLSQDILVAW
jgi:hypothetical protein